MGMEGRQPLDGARLRGGNGQDLDPISLADLTTLVNLDKDPLARHDAVTRLGIDGASIVAYFAYLGHLDQCLADL
jgi:hypothetical protein